MRLLPLDYAVRNLGRAPVRLVATLAGSTLLVFLLSAAAAFTRGMERSLVQRGTHDNVLLLGAGSEDTVERSQIPANTAEIVAASVPGLRSRLGVAYASPEVSMALLVKPERSAATEWLATFRGVTPTAFLVHEHVRIVEGRAPRAGADELLAGTLAATKLGVEAGRIAVGQQLWLDDRPWTIVGRFDAPGTVLAAEIWCPLGDLQIATRRDSLSCVVVTPGTAEFADLDAFCKERLDLELVAVREADYYARLLAFYRPIRAMVWATALLIVLGGVLGGLNTLYAAFAARIRELATLQTLGWSRAALVLTLVQEALLTSAAGALLGTVLGLILLRGAAVRLAMGAFGLSVDAQVVALALLGGLLLGAAGALPPAWRCLRTPIAEGLRQA